MGFPSVSQISRTVGRRCCEMLLKQNVFAVSVCKCVCVCLCAHCLMSVVVSKKAAFMYTRRRTHA